MTALRNDVTSYLQIQSQRLTETNDLRDSHAELLVATNETANELINLRNDITSHFQKQSHILSDSQGRTSVGKNRRPIDIKNKFKALEVPDGEISPKASDVKPDANSPLIINAYRSTPMTLADQLAEYDVNAADICERCRRVVQEYRSTGKSFHHVSVACQFLFSRKHFTTVRLS